MNVATVGTQVSGQDNWDDLDLNDFEFDSIEIIPTKGYLAMPETGASTCCCESCCSSSSGSSVF